MKALLVVMCSLIMLAGFGCASESRLFSSSGVKPVEDEIYKEECGACHMAYPPGLLPERSWKKIMNQLDDHNSENLELEQADAGSILSYLSANAADKSGYKRSKKVMDSLSRDATPIRITKVPYIRNKHKEIPNKFISGNPDVESLSNCNACHTKAALGIFDDDTVVIPSVGRWDD